MTVQEASKLAHQDPVPILTARWGQLTAAARQRVHALEDSLRELDKITEQLAGHDLTIATDLGATGNAAKAAWTTTQEHRERHDHDFTMPKAS